MKIDRQNSNENYKGKIPLGYTSITMKMRGLSEWMDDVFRKEESFDSTLVVNIKLSTEENSEEGEKNIVSQKKNIDNEEAMRDPNETYVTHKTIRSLFGTDSTSKLLVDFHVGKKEAWSNLSLPVNTQTKAQFHFSPSTVCI